MSVALIRPIRTIVTRLHLGFNCLPSESVLQFKGLVSGFLFCCAHSSAGGKPL